MKNNGKSFIISLLIILIILGSIVYIYKNNKLKIGKQTYSDDYISFEYPSNIKLDKTNNIIILSHSVPYTHPNPCDFKGDAPPLDKLTDFNVSIEVVNRSPKDYLENDSWPGWDFVSKNPFQFGYFSGYKVTPGVEGCGQDMYYLTISPNKTLIIIRPLISEFNTTNEEYQKLLDLPDIINSNKADLLFTEILSSIKVK